jgi:hypothetical protein
MNTIPAITPIPPINQVNTDGPVWPYYAVLAALIVTAAILYLVRLMKERAHDGHSSAFRKTNHHATTLKR